jgi:hypothetical protein
MDISNLFKEAKERGFVPGADISIKSNKYTISDVLMADTNQLVTNACYSDDFISDGIFVFYTKAGHLCVTCTDDDAPNTIIWSKERGWAEVIDKDLEYARENYPKGTVADIPYDSGAHGSSRVWSGEYFKTETGDIIDNANWFNVMQKGNWAKIVDSKLEEAKEKFPSGS